MGNKKYNLGVYEKAFPTSFSFKEKLLAAKETGFDFLEISIDETNEKIRRLYWNKEEKLELLKTIKESHLPIWTMCFSAQRKYSLGSINKQKEKKAKELMKLAIDFASDLGIRIIQLAGYDTYYEERNELSEKKFISNLKIATQFAASKGVLLGFETMMDRDFIDTIEKGMKYVNIVNSPYLNMYPDLGNLAGARHDNNYKKTIEEDLLIGKGKIVACHLKETRPHTDRNVEWGTGLTNYDDIKTLKELGVSMFNAEFWCTDESNWKEKCEYSKRFLTSKLDYFF